MVPHPVLCDVYIEAVEDESMKKCNRSMATKHTGGGIMNGRIRIYNDIFREVI